MRLAACLLAVLFALSACGGEAPKELPDLEPVKNAVSGFNEETLRSVSFLLNLTESGKEESKFFSQGNASYRTVYPVAMSGRMTQIYKGAGTTADIFYKAGAYYRSDNSSKYYVVMDKETLLGQFICANAPLLDESKVTGAKTATTGAGTKYTLDVETDAELLNTLFGETLYSSSGLKKPQRSKTSYKNAQYTYVIGSDGTLKSFKLTASVTLYETPAYYPNYQVSEKSLMHSFDISYELTVVKTGNGVEILVPKTEDYVFLS